MAIYHLSSSIISRGKGQSAIASAAYRSGEKLYSERYGETNFYRRELKPETFILKPNHAPEWTLDREKLWNGVEKIEKNINSQLSREMNISLPVELSHDEQRKLTEQYVQENFVVKGMVADVAIHRDDPKNPHFHVMLTLRPFEKNGEWGAKSKKEYILDDEGNKLKTEKGNVRSRKINTTDWNDKETFQKWRENWAKSANYYLEKNGFTDRISDQSHYVRGIEDEPTIHEGYVARQMEKRGEISERVEKNRQISKQNYDKQAKHNEVHTQEKFQNISNSLSPEEKKNLSRIAKNLKVYVNYDNLIDKQRMVRNWENSLKYNQIITDEEANIGSLNQIEHTKDDIDEAQAILEKQSERIFTKYYPELAEKTNYAPYYKQAIAQATLEKDQVLSKIELKDVLVEARDNRTDDLLKTIIKNPYTDKSSRDYQKALKTALADIDSLYDKHNVSKDTVHTLPEDDKQTYKNLLKKRDVNFDTLKLLDRYYTETIKSRFPTIDFDGVSVPAKETLAKILDYHGNKLSTDSFIDFYNSKQVNKYTYTEQQVGVELLKRIDSNSLTADDLNKINGDYRLKELYDTVSNPNKRPIFENEVNGNQKESFTNQFVGLVSNTNLVQNIYEAQMDNIRRDQEDERERHKQKKNKSKKKQQKNGRSQS